MDNSALPAGSDGIPGKIRTLLPARVHLDLPLLIALLLLCGYGLLVLFSAVDQDLDKLYRQLTRLGIAFAVMIVVAQVPPLKLRHWSLPLFGIGLVLLVGVLVIGEMGKGAQRWLNLGVVRFQPSEVLKIAVPMMLAWYLAERPLPPSGSRILGTVVLTTVPVLLIARQPDLGTALLVASTGMIVLFLAGLKWRLIAVLGIGAAALVPLLWYFMRPYQQRRILSFLNPEGDPFGTGYHIIQSKIAIGSGGVHGKGWLKGTQSHLEFLPERSTDFVFAILGEEFGLIGILVMLVIYLFIIVRGLYIATQAQDTYGRLLSGGLTLIFFVYLFVNAGMVTGLLPVVGIPLPLVSYGGTSLVTIMAGFGILMSIHTHRKLLPS
ncbi:rod shape-determining protein RodA [Candidatus Thiosymbion oneisti]|uniref:rod shape-determining protein RodA n=1 Tax=Candidatus Thiosymbion oneisti TaxID=589554 RepID=UPI000A415E7C|nr:rod shape-determining protein RodA [Candidatus Thiosymbion oneisti]